MSDLGKPSMSPSCVVTTLRTWVLPITSCSVRAKFSRITIAVAPESLSWCSSSRGVYSGLQLTTVIPARSTPKSAIGYWSRLGIMIATRSSFFSPATFCSQLPKRIESRSSAA